MFKLSFQNTDQTYSLGAKWHKGVDIFNETFLASFCFLSHHQLVEKYKAVQEENEELKSAWSASEEIRSSLENTVEHLRKDKSCLEAHVEGIQEQVFSSFFGEYCLGLIRSADKLYSCWRCAHKWVEISVCSCCREWLNWSEVKNVNRSCRPNCVIKRQKFLWMNFCHAIFVFPFSLPICLNFWCRLTDAVERHVGIQRNSGSPTNGGIYDKKLTVISLFPFPKCTPSWCSFDFACKSKEGCFPLYFSLWRNAISSSNSKWWRKN